MDLQHDWKTLNEVLFPREGVSFTKTSLVMLSDQNKIIDGAVSTGTMFKDIGLEGVGQSKEKLDELAAKYNVKQSIILSKQDLDQAIRDVAGLGTNYFQQLEFLRQQLLESKMQNTAVIVSQKHFLLDLFGRSFQKFLPRKFNVLVYIDQRSSSNSFALGTSQVPAQAVLLSYSKGQLDQFFEPDFSSLHENRLEEWPKEYRAMGEYLENRYMLPCYGIFMYKEVWERCLRAATGGAQKPWHVFVKEYDLGNAAIFPNNLLTKTLLVTQRIMMYFRRL